MKNKGFTLVETIAVLVILGILLTISVPAILKYMQIQRETTMKEDAERFEVTVKEYVESNLEIEYPIDKGKIYFYLKYFNSKDFKLSPYGKKYLDTSYVMLECTDSCTYTTVLSDGTNAFKLVNGYYSEYEADLPDFIQDKCEEEGIGKCYYEMKKGGQYSEDTE